MSPVDVGNDMESRQLRVFSTANACVAIRLGIELIVLLRRCGIRFEVKLDNELAFNICDDCGETLKHIPSSLLELRVAK